MATTTHTAAADDAAAAPKKFVTYDALHALVRDRVAPKVQAFRPDAIVAIGGGGFVPARMLRSHLDGQVPIVAVTLSHYTPEDRMKDAVDTVQWLDAPALERVRGKRVVVVDEVDETRESLRVAVERLRRDSSSAPSSIMVAVVHNKLHPSKRVDERALADEYVAAETVPADHWIVYPWDQPERAEEGAACAIV